MFWTWSRRSAATQLAKGQNMFGFFFGTLCLIGLVATFKRRHHSWGRYAYGMGHHHGWGRSEYGHGAEDGPPWARSRPREGGRRRAWLRPLFEHLDTTPGQEKAIVKIVESFTQQMADGRAELSTLRKQVAQALGGDVLDESILSSVLERVEDMMAKTKLELAQALTELHASLDGTQRKLLAEIIADGLPRRGFGYERF